MQKTKQPELMAKIKSIIFSCETVEVVCKTSPS